MMTDSTPTEMSTLLATMNTLMDKMDRMEKNMDKIDRMEKNMDKLNRDVKKTRIMCGSLVETNIRSFFIKEYGESFSRQYTAIDLSGLIYLATPRELRKSSTVYPTLMEQWSTVVKAIYTSKVSELLCGYLLGDIKLVGTNVTEMKNQLMQLKSSETNPPKKTTLESFVELLTNMLNFPNDHEAMMNELDKACSHISTRSIVFAFITSMVVNACGNATPPLDLQPERIWNDKQLEFDLRGQCEVKRSVGGSKTVVVRTGEVKSSLTGKTKTKAVSQLVVRSLTIALAAVLCDSDIDQIEADCLVVAFNPSKSTFERSHTLKFSLGSDKKPRDVTAMLRFTSVIPPNTAGLKDLDDKEDEEDNGEISSSLY
jgi:hypothetical protein